MRMSVNLPARGRELWRHAESGRAAEAGARARLDLNSHAGYYTESL